VAPWLLEGQAAGWSLAESIIHTHLRLLATEPDSLVVRKRGLALAVRLMSWAASVLETGMPGDDDYHAGLADFDFWLRSDGHSRNPGTTADLIGAGLFVLLRENRLELASGVASAHR
jgi:triphosphoribosyl-dephospho-CoA synthase